uniref:Uncharacterized protein n=1 Tax=Lepeophtheirus salmonis TaxID=72036 RepID=A0A0K2VHC0_LEPSM
MWVKVQEEDHRLEEEVEEAQ